MVQNKLMQNKSFDADAHAEGAEELLQNKINWFPGHIAKAQRQLKEKISMVDCVIELVDARLPLSSHFPFVDDIAHHKDRIVVLNKIDLAPPEAVDAAVAHWKGLGYPTVALDVPRRKGLNDLKQALNVFYDRLATKMKKRGRLPRKLRVMVMGLPNVGKSSLINALIGKRSLKVGNKPGVTRGLQWTAIAKNLELLDTPGVIPPNLDDQTLALKLALIGSISEHAADITELAEAGLQLLSRDFPGILEEMYEMEPMTLHDFAQRRGFLVKGGESNLRRAAEAFLLEIRSGNKVRFSLETAIPANNS